MNDILGLRKPCKVDIVDIGGCSLYKEIFDLDIREVQLSYTSYSRMHPDVNKDQCLEDVCAVAKTLWIGLFRLGEWTIRLDLTYGKKRQVKHCFDHDDDDGDGDHHHHQKKQK
jgi:hypothetical protein